MKKAPKKPGAEENVMQISLYSEPAKSQGRSREFCSSTIFIFFFDHLHIIDTAFQSGLTRLK
jgi:hypothetical protein